MNTIPNRILYNGDCSFLFMGYPYHTGPGPFTAEVLHSFIGRVADSGVDTYLNNINSQAPWYASKAVPGILNGYRRGDREFVRGHLPPANDTDLPLELLNTVLDEHTRLLDRLLDLQEAGVDSAAEIAAACRRRGIAAWASFRMNDAHGSNNWQGSYMTSTPQKDPRLRLEGKQYNSREEPLNSHKLTNYEHREVRDYYYAMIREIVEDYDYEGIELDWTRHPFCCEAPASEATIATMTEWIGGIRALTEAKARATGKPYPLGLRIPVRLDVLRTIGLDVRAMARQGSIDFIAPTNDWQTTWDVPFDELRAELGVAIFGVIEAAPNWLFARNPESGRESYRLLPTSVELMRGNAANKLAAGADAIELFNFFCAEDSQHDSNQQEGKVRYEAIRGLDDLEGLRGKPKHYTLATTYGLWIFQLFEYNDQIPVLLEPQWSRAFKLTMCAEPAHGDLELTIQLVVENKEALTDLGVSFNGSWPNYESVATDRLLFPAGDLTSHTEAHIGLNYRFPVEAIKEGWNELVVFNGHREEATPEERQRNSAVIKSVELAVKPRAN